MTRPIVKWGLKGRFSVGGQHNLSPTLTAGVSYTLIWSGPGDVDQVALPPARSVVLDREYAPFFLHALGFTLTGRF